MKLSNLFIVVILFGAIVSCAEDVSVSYKGPSLIEFPLSASTVVEGSGEINIQTQLVGPQESSPVTVNFVVDESSTAIEGTHYSLVTDGSIQIAAETSSGQIVVNVSGTSLAADETVTLILRLTGGDHPPSENYKTHTLTIVGE